MKHDPNATLGAVEHEPEDVCECCDGMDGYHFKDCINSAEDEDEG